MLSSWSDNTGRIVSSIIEFGTRKIAIVSAYAPNVFDGNFYNMLTNQMLELTDCSFVVGVDFNAVWYLNIDRLNAKAAGEQAQATNALKSWANSLGLIDIWRAVNPTCKDSSFF